MSLENNSINYFRRLTRIGLPALLGLAFFSTGCAELDTLRTRTASQETELTRLRKENADFREAYYQTKEALEGNASSLQKNLDDTQHQLADAKTLKTQQEKTLGDDLRTRTLERDALKNENAEQKRLADAQIGQLTQNMQTMTSERDAALARVTDIDAKLTQEQARTKTLNDSLAAIKVEQQQQSAKLEAMQKDTVKREQDLKAEKDARLAAEKKSTDLDKQLAAALKTAEETKTADEAKKAADEATKAASEANKTIEAAKTKDTDTQKQLAAAAAAAKELKTVKDEKAALQAQLDKTKTQTPPAPAAAPSLESDAKLKEVQTELTAALDKAPEHKGTDVRLDKTGLRIILPSDLVFEKGGTLLSDGGNSLVRAVAPIVARLAKERRIRVEGHTDSQPVAGGDLPFADNWGLGFARADRVRLALMDAGVSGSAMTALTRAQFSPLKTGDTSESRAANRRVEIVIGGSAD